MVHDYGEAAHLNGGGTHSCGGGAIGMLLPDYDHDYMVGKLCYMVEDHD